MEMWRTKRLQMKPLLEMNELERKGKKMRDQKENEKWKKNREGKGNGLKREEWIKSKSMRGKISAFLNYTCKLYIKRGKQYSLDQKMNTVFPCFFLYFLRFIISATFFIFGNFILLVKFFLVIKQSFKVLPTPIFILLYTLYFILYNKILYYTL